jgi:hypothetical protein
VRLYLHSLAHLHGVALKHTNFSPQTIQRNLLPLHFLLISLVTLPHYSVFAIFTSVRRDEGYPTISPICHMCYSSCYQPEGHGGRVGESTALLQGAHNVVGTFSSPLYYHHPGRQPERWSLIFVGPQYVTCFMSPLLCLEFSDGS